MRKSDSIKPSNIRDFFKSSLWMKILSLFFGVLLWLYVLSAEDPYRQKGISAVPMHFEGEALMNADKLVISGEKSDVLVDADVTVSARASVIDQVNASGINVYADLKSVRTPGKHSVRVFATSNVGTVVSIKPATVEVEVDMLSTRTVPVTVRLDGDLKDGYWHGDSDLSPASITLTGPLSSIEKVSQAVCDIELSDRTKSINESIKVSLLDENGDAISKTGFVGDLPSVIVRMPIYPKKVLPLDVAGAFVGMDKLPEGYEVLWNKATPAAVEVAAPKETLDSLTKLSIESVNLQDAKESILKTSKILKPSGNVVFTGADATEVYVEIGEKQGEVRYDELSISYVGLGEGLRAELLKEKASITLTGPLSQIDALRRSDVKLTVDLTDRAIGTYNVPIDVSLPEEFKEKVKTTTSPSIVTMIITSRN